MPVQDIEKKIVLLLNIVLKHWLYLSRQTYRKPWSIVEGAYANMVYSYVGKEILSFFLGLMCSVYLRLENPALVAQLLALKYWASCVSVHCVKFCFDLAENFKPKIQQLLPFADLTIYHLCSYVFRILFLFVSLQSESKGQPVNSETLSLSRCMAARSWN